MTPSKQKLVVVVLCGLVLGAALVKTAWVCDDAYITFRTIDNFLDGRGLVWNLGERVQSYTHPLWMFLLTAACAATEDPFYAAIWLGMAVSMAAVIFLITRHTETILGALFCTAILVFSKSFVEYSTSGLENPATHLLCAIFLWLFLERERWDKRSLFWLCLVASLLALNRLDALLLLLPALVYVLISHRRWSAVPVLLLGFSPFIAWSLFSLFYYGFPLPNTAYAKLSTGIPERQLLDQGVVYFLSSVNFEPLTLAAIAAGLLFPLITRDRRSILVAGGIFGYLLYIAWIGGDFMSGRFFSAPLLCAVVVLGRYRWPEREHLLIAFAAVLVFGIANPYSPLRANNRYTNMEMPGGVADERGYYFNSNGLLNARRGYVPVRDHRWVLAAEQKLAEHRERQDKYYVDVVVREDVGMYGYYSAPDMHIVDYYGLVDPLLARLPSRYQPEWRIGHFLRAVPDGYVQTLRSGTNVIVDRDLAEYYDKLALITRGPLWSGERLIEILKMNLGWYRSLVDRAKYRYPDQLLVARGDLPRALQAAPILNGERCLPLPDSGIRIKLGELAHAPRLGLRLDHDDTYLLIAYRGEEEAASLDIPVLRRKAGGMSLRLVELPERLSEKGYDAIAVLPVRVERKSCIGGIALLD